jgi:peptide/nickel transport system ATP-binding protein
MDSEIPSAVRCVGDEPRKLKLKDVGSGHLVAT